MKLRIHAVKAFVRTVTILATFFLGQNVLAAAPVKSSGQRSLILENGQILGDKKVNKPQGPRTGGGGNSCALSIVQNTDKLRTLLYSFTDILTEDQRYSLFEKMENAKFYLASDLMIDGQSKDAINYPVEQEILLTPRICRYTFADVNGQAMALLLHEYLGLAEIDDTRYLISGQFLEAYTEYASTTVLLQESGANIEMAGFALKEFMKQANDSKSKFGKIIRKKNAKTVDGRNHEGAIKFPITKDQLQFVIVEAVDSSSAWRDAEVENGYCVESSDSARYQIFLSVKAGAMRATELETLKFEVSVSSTARMKGPKGIKKGYECEDAIGEDPDNLFGPVRYSYEVEDIKYLGDSAKK